MTVLIFRNINGKNKDEQWLLTDKGQMIHATGSIHWKGVPEVEVTQNGEQIKNELLDFSRDVLAATKKARG